LSTAATKYGPASPDRSETQLATVPKLKSAKAAGKQHGPKLDEFPSPDRLTREETIDVLKDIQHHFVIRTSAAIDDETDCLRIDEPCGERPGSAVIHDASGLIAFQKAVALADRQYAGALLDAEMNSSGEAMASAGQIPECEQVAVIHQQLHIWRELSVGVIHSWAPKFFGIASRFQQQINQAWSEWTKAKLLEGVNRRLRPAQLGAVTFWLKAACGERDKEPEDSLMTWKMPTWFVSPPAPPSTNTNGHLQTKKPRAEEHLVFNRTPAGLAVAEKGFSNLAFFNTNESMVQTLDLVRAEVRHDPTVAASALRGRFSDTKLYEVGSENWEIIVDAFRPAPRAKQRGKHFAEADWKESTLEKVARVVLRNTTNLEEKTILKRITLGRKAKKTQEARQGNLR
jgi:hypothetical protein